LKYPLSFRNLKDIMMERGIEVSHTSIMRWTQQYAPILEKKVRRHLLLMILGELMKHTLR